VKKSNGILASQLRSVGEITGEREGKRVAKRKGKNRSRISEDECSKKLARIFEMR